MDAKTAINALGRAAIARALGVSANAVGEAARAGAMPASWFLVIRALCADAAVEFSEAWFSFKRPAPSAPHPPGHEPDGAAAA